MCCLFFRQTTAWLALEKKGIGVGAKLSHIHRSNQLKPKKSLLCQVSFLDVTCNESPLKRLYWLIDRVKNTTVTLQNIKSMFGGHNNAELKKNHF